MVKQLRMSRWIAGLVALLGIEALAANGQATTAQPKPITEVKVRVLRSKPGRHFARAAAETLPDGTWLLVYREADHHAKNLDGRLHAMFSADRGKTWSAEDHDLDGQPIKGFPAWPPGAAPGQPTGPGEPWLYQTPDGKLILHSWKVK